jgi:hypothetical protein
MDINVILGVFLALLNQEVPQQMGEKAEQTQARYESVILNTLTIAFDETKTPLFDGKQGRVRTAATMLAIDVKESNLRRDVDVGSLRGDSNGSWCLAQVNLNGGKILITPDGSFKYLFGNAVEGWSGHDLVSDRLKCFTAQLSILQSSFKCDVPERHKLTAYASGHCGWAKPESEIRMDLAKKFWDKIEFTDDEVIKALKDEVEYLYELEH